MLKINYKLAVLVYKWLHEGGPAYLADELSHSSDFESRHRLRLASSLTLNVRRTYGPYRTISTYGDCAF